MATSFRKKIFLLVFCLASITQGMYSTYFVSILTTIERIYQIQSKTAGAILSATEIGQILGSLFIAYYGGRGNKPKWISVCMTLSAFAALISISPHFILLATNKDTNINYHHQQQQAGVGASSSSSLTSAVERGYGSGDGMSLNRSTIAPYLTSDLSSGNGSSNGGALGVIEHTLAAHSKVDLPSFDQLCRLGNYGSGNDNRSTVELSSTALNTTLNNVGQGSGGGGSLPDTQQKQRFPVTLVISIFSICLLAIGFGSTAITTLGIPFIDDIISREESPFYLGLTIGLRIFGPALGFLLGSFCIRLNANSLFPNGHLLNNQFGNQLLPDQQHGHHHEAEEIGAWWLGLIIISLPLLVLAIPMYFLSRVITSNDSEKDDYEDITYQAAEDHDIGGSHDFPAHVLGITVAGGGGGDGCDLDVTSGRTCFSSEIDSSSREVLARMVGPGRGSPGVIIGRDNITHHHYKQNIAFEQPILTGDNMAGPASKCDQTDAAGANGQLETNVEWRAAPNVCLVVNHLNDLESTSFTNDLAKQHNQRGSSSSSSSSCCDVPPSLRPRQGPISTRSSVASTMSSSSFVNEKNKFQRRKHQQHQQQIKQVGGCGAGDIAHTNKSTLGDLSSSLSRLLANRLLTLRMLSGVLHILPIAGFYTFLPKYLMEQFMITSSSASAISGLAGILFVGFGAFIGGTIIRLFNVNSRIMTRWIATSALVYALGMILLMNLDCKQNQIVHFNSLEFVSTDCSLSCKCSRATYNPVCANGTTFMSPCLAGCKGHTITEGRVIFDECGCTSLSTHANDSLRGGGDGDPILAADSHINLNVATQGQCISNCDNIVWYVILFSIFTLVHASCEVGSMMFNLRCVKSDDRTLALGLITFSSSLLGTIPCSIIYGSVVDFTCVHWDTYFPSNLPMLGRPDEPAVGDISMRGACRAYDNDSFRYYLHGLTAMVMSLAFIVDCIISSRASEVDFYEGTDESKIDIRIGLKKSTETIQ